MEPYELKRKDPIYTLKKRVWRLYDITRRVGLRPDQNYVILLFLSIFKDGLFFKIPLFSNTDRLKGNAKDYLNLQTNDLPESDRELSRNYDPIISSFLNSLKEFDEHEIFEMEDVLKSIDKKVLTNNFSKIFDYVLYEISRSQGTKGGEIIQPVELTRLMCGLANLEDKARVFNPFAGLASYGVYLDYNEKYFGQEIDRTTWALGALRLMAYDRYDSSKYICDDSILNWPDQKEKFDLIIASPPYGMRLNQKYKGINPNIRAIEHFLIEKGINSLSKKGKLIALMPQGFLFRGRHEQLLRARLIEEDLIETIIALPGGLLLNTGIPLIVVVINMKKKLPGKVRFIDAENFVKVINSREKGLNDSELLKYIQGNIIYEQSEKVFDNPNQINEPHSPYGLSFSEQEGKISNIERVVDANQIKTFDYNLNVPRYFQNQIEGVKLKEIIEFVRGKKMNSSDEGKIIQIRDLKDDKLDFSLNLSNVEKRESNVRPLRLIDESCILLATRWKTLKPTLFEFSGTPIFLNPDILSFKIVKQVTDPAYLINELHADYVLEQLNSYRQGSTMPMLRRDDLLEVVIKLPSLEEQRAKMQGILELSDRIKILQQERNALAHGKDTRQFNEFASLKHTLGRPRQNILDWTDNLIHFLSDNRTGFDALNKSFSDFYKTDILSALQEIKRDVNFMTAVLEKGENGFVVEKFDKTIISISDINILVNELSSNGFNFNINKLLLKGELLKERGIHGNKILLKTLIDNLLTNAHKYGFDKKSLGNEVVFELKEVDDFLSMEVRNNGKPFPKNFDRDKFITKYSTADSKSGSGLGGYDIHRIATEFNNPNWELTLNEDPIYPVKFKFQFPIKLIN